MFAIFVSAEYVGPCSLLAGEFPNPVREKSALVGPRDVPKSHNPLLQTAARGVPDRSIARNVIVPGANDTDPAAVAAPSIAGSSVFTAGRLHPQRPAVRGRPMRAYHRWQTRG
jgi:hypothetical protein